MGKAEGESMMTHDELHDKIEAIDYWQEHFANRTFLKALLAVVELHKPELHQNDNLIGCIQCSSFSFRYVTYPCPTIQVIEKELA